MTAVDGMRGAEERGITRSGGLASAGVEVTGSGAINGGGKDFCGVVGVVVVSSAREPRTDRKSVV